MIRSKFSTIWNTLHTLSSTRIFSARSFSRIPGAAPICNLSRIDSRFLAAAWNCVSPTWRNLQWSLNLFNWKWSLPSYNLLRKKTQSHSWIERHAECLSTWYPSTSSSAPGSFLLSPLLIDRCIFLYLPQLVLQLMHWCIFRQLSSVSDISVITMLRIWHFAGIQHISEAQSKPFLCQSCSRSLCWMYQILSSNVSTSTSDR